MMRSTGLVLAFCLAAPLAASTQPTPQRTTVGDWIRAKQAAASASAQVQAQSATAGALSPSAQGVAKDVSPSPPLFAAGETAAAYQVDEHIFGHEAHVIGINQAVTVALESQGGLRRVVVTAPSNKFKTNSGTRDGRVASHLGGSGKSVLVSSAWFPASDLAKFENGLNTVPGSVTVRGNSAPVTFTARGDAVQVRVDVVTSFDAISVPPPDLGPFGMLGEVHQPLTLSAQIQLKDVSGLK